MTNDLVLEKVEQALRARHYSRLTEKAYLGWLRRFVRFFDGRSLLQMGDRQISEFLTHLAINLDVGPGKRKTNQNHKAK